MELSHRAGDAQALNMVMMGALGGWGLMPLSAAELEEEMIGSLPVRFADTNRRAFRLGVGAAQRWARADGGVPRAPVEN
ncbi:MAG: indolepyruvate oxidoreductase subunit beta [Actinobacteria bacterium ADurb.Bin444]|nr:MAG: indolepyruvate oxidoreductase subunit beta [Actinobacteria bacterium ADurb.Bin444]